MSSNDELYAITFNSEQAGDREAAEVLRRANDDVRDACASPTTAQPSEKGAVLNFSEIGVCFARLEVDEAERIRRHRKVLQCRRVRDVPLPSHAVPAHEVSISSTEHGKDAPVGWNIQMVKADQVWDRTTGAGIKVGVFGSGVDRNHPALEVADGLSLVDGEPYWNDDSGIGTHCAGIIGARRHGLAAGVAPDCSLYAVKVAHGGQWNTLRLLAGMIWAAEQDLDVVCLTVWDQEGAETPNEEPWIDVHRGARMLAKNNCLVVGAVGDTGRKDPNHWVTNPVRSFAIVGVGAVDQRNRVWDDSAYGTEVDWQSVEMVAPGVDVRSTFLNGQFGMLSGTSQSCAHVAGAAALLRDAHPDWTLVSLRYALEFTADRPPDSVYQRVGSGLLNCAEAVSATMGRSPDYYRRVAGIVHSVTVQGRLLLVKFKPFARAGGASNQWPGYSPDAGYQSIFRGTLRFDRTMSGRDLTWLTATAGKELAVYGVLEYSREPYSHEALTARSILDITVR